jgi:hypothetical protein
MRRVAICVLLMSTLMTAKQQQPTERVIGTAIFLNKSDGVMQPVFPVRIHVSREGDGKIQQRAGSLSCEVRARVRDVGNGLSVIQTVLKCDDGGTYVVTGCGVSGRGKMKRRFRDWHHTKAGETVAELYHWLWAILCFAQFGLTLSYAWLQWSIMVVFNYAPAAQAVFWIYASGAVFGLLAAIWHAAAALCHGHCRRSARRGQ